MVYLYFFIYYLYIILLYYLHNLKFSSFLSTKTQVSEPLPLVSPFYHTTPFLFHGISYYLSSILPASTIFTFSHITYELLSPPYHSHILIIPPKYLNFTPSSSPSLFIFDIDQLLYFSLPAYTQS